MPSSKRGAAKRAKKRAYRMGRDYIIPVRVSADEGAAWRAYAKDKDSSVASQLRDAMNRRIARAK